MNAPPAKEQAYAQCAMALVLLDIVELMEALSMVSAWDAKTEDALLAEESARSAKLYRLLQYMRKETGKKQMQRYCPQCGKPATTGKFCQECGYSFEKKAESKGLRNILLAVIAVALVCITLALAYLILFDDEETTKIVENPSAGYPGNSGRIEYDDSLPVNNREEVQNPGQSYEDTVSYYPTESEVYVADVEVGDIVTFGTYEQDGSNANGKEDIMWIVLDVQNGDALLLSLYALDAHPYHNTTQNVRWESCELRSWLNHAFMNEAFTGMDQSRILTTTVTADGNPEYNTDPGSDTHDQVFLLSAYEVDQYFPVSGDAVCLATSQAQAKGVYTTDDGRCRWWLRTPGEDQDDAMVVNYSNRDPVDTDGWHTTSDRNGVRPAIWVSLAG